MAMAAMVAALTGIPQALQEHYKPQTVNGQQMFVLDVTPHEGWALEDVKGLKNSLSAARTERDTATEQLKAFKDLDPVKAREALTKVEEMKDWKPDQKVREQIEARERQLLEKHTNEIKSKDEAVTALTREVEELLIDSVATMAVTGAKGIPELLLPHIKTQTRVKRGDNGKHTVEILDKDGKTVRLSPKSGSTSNMTIQELVEEMRGNKTFARCFDGTNATGSGANGATKSGTQNQNNNNGQQGGGGGEGGGELFGTARLQAARRSTQGQQA